MMTTRPPISLTEVTPETYAAMVTFNLAAADNLDPVVGALVQIRASQLNGCGFCLDLHGNIARAVGIDPRKTATLAAWRRTPFFTPRERAALALAEDLTNLPGRPNVDLTFNAARDHFDDRELSSLIWIIAAINAWNRVAIPVHLEPAA